MRIIGRALRQWGANSDARLGAALAYYTLFSIAPLLVIAIFIAGLIFGEEAARGNVERQLRSTVGQEAAAFIQNLVDNAARPRDGTWAPVLGLALLLYGALTAFLHVRAALAFIWRMDPPGGSTILGIVLDYVLALVMVFASGVLLLVSVAASMAIPIVVELLRSNLLNFQDWIQENIPFLANVITEDLVQSAFRWQVVEFVTSMLFLTLLFATLYRVLSGLRITWRHVWYGSLIAALLFSLGKFGLSMYLVHTSTASTYGAAGSVVVFMVWVYYSSQILFFGAEMIQARRTRHMWLGK